MAGPELTGGYPVRSEQQTPEEVRWRKRIEEVDDMVGRFPEALLEEGEDCFPVETADGEVIIGYYLGNFRILPASGDAYTSLFLGYDEASGDYRLFEYGRSPLSVDDEGRAIEDNPVALRILDLETLPTDLLRRLQERVRPHLPQEKA